LLNDSAVISEYAMIVALMNYAFPVRIIMNYIYAKKTKKEYTIKTEDFFDLFISFLVTIWLVAFIVFSNSEVVNPYVAENSH
jgi:uncharacterized BrkB/YihY/UPF0761 family membrane protein